jgi:hypothetical protein
MDDIEFENFWFTLKRNMLNYYNDEKKISEWSDKLNSLKMDRKYHEIQLHILEYLRIMGTDLIKNYDLRIADIFLVNLKRWEKIVNKNNFLEKYSFNKYLNKFNKLKSFVYLTIKLNELLEKEKHNEYITNYYSENEFVIDNVLMLALKYNTVSILEHLYNLYDMDEYILKNYNLNVVGLKSTKKMYLLKKKLNYDN